MSCAKALSAASYTLILDGYANLSNDPAEARVNDRQSEAVNGKKPAEQASPSSIASRVFRNCSAFSVCASFGAYAVNRAKEC